MKKFMILVVGIFLIFGVSGCLNNPTAPNPPATVYDPTPTATQTATETLPEATPTATATATVSAVATETWKIEIVADAGTTFEMTYASVNGGNVIEILFSSTTCVTDSNGDWKTTDHSFNADYQFSYSGKVTGMAPSSFILNFYKNGSFFHTTTVYPDVSGNAPDFGGSYN